MKPKDLTGQQFGNLTVLRLTPAYEPRRPAWICSCACGSIITALYSNLTSGHTKSCGCIRGLSRRKAPGESARNSLISNYRYHANHRGYTWGLDLHQCEVLFQGACFYCGAKPSSTWKGAVTSYTYNGIDRIDNNQGYTVGNVVSCCGRCNKAKSTMTQTEFIALAHAISKRHKELP